MKEIILHVGFHKTATSSIQKTLFSKGNDFGDYVYPVFKLNESSIINHSIPFYSMFCDRPELYRMNVVMGSSENIEAVNKEYQNQLFDFMKNDKLIFSGEDISMLSEDKLFHMKSLFEMQGYKVKVYCAVRRPFSFLCSELQERVKAGFHSLNKIKVHKKTDDIEKLMRVFGSSVVFFNFESYLKGDGIVKNFIKLIGFEPKDIQVESANEGLSNWQVRVLDFLNFCGLSLGSMSEEFKGFFHLKSGDKFLLSNDEFDLISDAVFLENEKMHALLGSQFCDVDYKFSKSPFLSVDDSVLLYNEFRKVGVNAKKIIAFINDNSCFDLLDFSEKLNNVDVYREVAILFEEEDLYLALHLMHKAYCIRPSGPLINEKIKKYNEMMGFEV